MARVKKENTNHYELMYIVANKYTEEELSPIKAKVEKMITDLGGSVIGVEEWGKKHMSYVIKGNRYGYYIILRFDLDYRKLKELDRAFLLSTEVIRHMVISRKIKTAAEMEKDQKIAAKIAAKAKVEETKEQEKEKEKEKDKKKVDLKELDEKLDKILEADDLL